MRRILIAALAAAFTIGAGPATVDPSYLTNLQWRSIGPFRGGRALAVTGVPGQPSHFYFGAVDGGVWESLDAGRTWNPIFDEQDIGSIGSIAVAPSAPNVIYVGTGEADMRSDIAYGDGVFVSTDSGKTWKHSGLEDTRQIGAVVVDPRDPKVAYVAALGHQYGPNEQRGVFKTVDGGASWTKILYRDADTGAASLAMDPQNPNVLYASLWQTRRPPWNVYPPSNGPGSGLYKTTDAGKTWTHLINGLPARTGRIGIAVAPSDPRRVYANIDSDRQHGGVYRSDDAGATWTHADGDPRIWQRGWYFSGITVDPKKPDVVYVMDTATYRSTDGGKNFEAIRGAPGGDDYHTLWVDPSDGNRMILGSDQGVVVSVNGAQTWSSWYNQPTAQFYHVTVDDRFPYWVYGAQQDSGAATAPSSTKYATISQQDFRPIDVGGESSEIAVDPKHPGLVYGGTVTKEDLQSGWEQNIDPTLNYPDTTWRNTWTLPIVFSPVDKTSLYFGRQNVFRSRNGGSTWQIVSPDLSRANEGTPTNLDPTTLADDNGLQRHGVVYTIAPSPLLANLVWAGTDDGNVWVTRDAAAHWSNVTPPALTPWSKVGTIEASHFDAASAYAAVDRHRLEDYRAYIYRTHDGGTSWAPIANGIPDGSFVNVVREDPQRRGLLYAGTERGVYVSFDDGDRWQPLQLNLPVSSIRDIAVHANDIIVATHGRAFWVLDDVASLRQMSAALAAAGPFLFAPANAYRTRPGNEEGTPLPLDEPQAQNAATGAYIDYYLPAAATTPVEISITGNTLPIAHWSSADKLDAPDPMKADIAPQWLSAPQAVATSAGAHRFVWDFHVVRDDGSHHLALVPPGTYAVTLRLNGKAYKQNVEILRDPRIAADDSALIIQYAFAQEIARMIHVVGAARDRAKALDKKILIPGQKHILQTEVIGEGASDDPDNSVGSAGHDFTSFTFLDGAFSNLFDAVESADALPTKDMTNSYMKLTAIYNRTLARLNAMERMR
jgi:photosystem II stability/assembly factor-like uncharacterized protein